MERRNWRATREKPLEALVLTIKACWGMEAEGRTHLPEEAGDSAQMWEWQVSKRCQIINASALKAHCVSSQSGILWSRGKAVAEGRSANTHRGCSHSVLSLIIPPSGTHSREFWHIQTTQNEGFSFCWWQWQLRELDLILLKFTGLQLWSVHLSCGKPHVGMSWLCLHNPALVCTWLSCHAAHAAMEKLHYVLNQKGKLRYWSMFRFF